VNQAQINQAQVNQVQINQAQINQAQVNQVQINQAQVNLRLRLIQSWVNLASGDQRVIGQSSAGHRPVIKLIGRGST
jgi:hypothetical protein